MDKLKNFLFNNIYPKQIVLKNVFWLYLSEGISKGLRILIFLFIAHILGPHNFGIFEYLLSFVGMFFLFSDFGISTIFIRDYQQKEEKNKLINNAFLLKLILSLIFGFISLFGYFFAKKIDGILIYLVFVLFYIFQNLENFFESYFIALQKTEKKFIFNTLSSLVLFVLIFLGLLFYKNIFVVALAYLISILSGLLLAYYLFQKENKISLEIDLSLVRYYLFNGLPLVLFGILGFIFFSTDKIILGHLRSIEEVGYYSAATRIISALFVIPSLFNTALFPYLANKVKEIKQNNDSINTLFTIFVLGSILSAFISSIIVFLIAPFLVKFLFGEQFIFSIFILQIFVWITIFTFPTNFLDFFLISYNKQWLDFGITLIPAILNVILNFVLIPHYGVFGAVFASILAQALNFFLSLGASILILKRKLV